MSSRIAGERIGWAGLDRLDELQAAAETYRAEKSDHPYIRPIMLVPAERTGKDHRDAGHIHALDVRRRLLEAGLGDAQAAIKTAEQNDLAQPENQDLLSPAGAVRVVVTMAALQEGWDCPFACVLRPLAAASNLSAMTQLGRRILRQPGALKTENRLLDECHVIMHHASTGDVVAGIKRSLEADGLADLVIEGPAGAAAGGSANAPAGSNAARPQDRFASPCPRRCAQRAPRSASPITRPTCSPRSTGGDTTPRPSPPRFRSTSEPPPPSCRG